jgi:hypothetical protein
LIPLCYLGYPEQAQTRMHEALQMTQDLGSLYNLVRDLGWTAWLRIECGEGRVAQEQAEVAVALCREHGFPGYMAWGIAFRGGALIAQGQWAEGVAQVQQGLGG